MAGTERRSAGWSTYPLDARHPLPDTWIHHWSDFFHKYAQLRPSALQQVTFTPWHMSPEDVDRFLMTVEFRGDWYFRPAKAYHMTFLHSYEFQGTVRQVFPYGTLDDYHWVVSLDWALTGNRYLTGEDQHALEELEEVMRTNRGRHALLMSN